MQRMCVQAIEIEIIKQTPPTGRLRSASDNICYSVIAVRIISKGFNLFVISITLNRCV